MEGEAAQVCEGNPFQQQTQERKKKKERYIRGCRDNRNIPAIIFVKGSERCRFSIQKVPPNPGSQDVDGILNIPNGFEVSTLLEVMFVSNSFSILFLTRVERLRYDPMSNLYWCRWLMNGGVTAYLDSFFDFLVEKSFQQIDAKFETFGRI